MSRSSKAAIFPGLHSAIHSQLEPRSEYARFRWAAAAQILIPHGLEDFAENLRKVSLL